MTACVLCDIGRGAVPAAFVENGSETFTIVDQRQPGWRRGAHLLVVPRHHVEVVADLPDELAGELMIAATRAARAVRRTIDPDGVSLWSSNGSAAGQEIPHVHLHVMCRYQGDELLRVYPDRPARPGLTDLQHLAEQLRASEPGFGSS